MKFQIEQSDLMSLLARTQNIVEKRNTMPILGNVLLEAKNGNLQIFATDLEVSLTDVAKIEMKEPGRVAVDARSLFNLIKEFPQGMIQISKKPNNWIEMKFGKSSFDLVGLPAEEYPVFPTYSVTEFNQINSAVLLDMINKTIYSVSNDETRYHLNGVFFEFCAKEKGTLIRMVATDGHRLSMIEREAEIPNASISNQGVIIPRKGLNEIRKLLEAVDGTIDLAIEGSQLIVKAGHTVIMVRLIEGKYPNYNQLIPQNFKKTFEVGKENFVSVLRRLSQVSNQKSKGITLHFSKGNLEISSNNPELGSGKDPLEIQYDGEEIKIGFNARYLLDIMNSFEDDKVDIYLNDQLSPGLFRPHADSRYTNIVMPMRI